MEPALRIVLVAVAVMLSGAVVAPAAESAPARPPADPNWDETAGLWISKGPGHTRPVARLPQVHPGPLAANRLLGAAQRGQLAMAPVTRVLRALRELQWRRPGAKFGCFRWYAEESEPVDTNAAFFIGLPLLTLDGAYHDKLEPESQQLLADIFKDLKVWFDGEAPKLNTIYPNKYLGDLVCGWLLEERAGDDAGRAKLERTMHQAARAWRDGHWGWGEHLSDGYCGIMLDELSTLLLLSRALPTGLRAEYQGLLDELLAIEDAFGNRPRVPTVRSYAFESLPSHLNYRERVRAADGTDPRHVIPPAPGGAPPAAKASSTNPTLYELGWHDKMPPRAAPRKDIRIAAAGGAAAVCRAEDDMQLGTLTRYPLIPNTDHEGSGLSWQTMPVAFLRNGTDWGFLRFYAKEGDRERGLPALEKHWAYLSNALSVKSKTLPVGQTWSLQHGGDAVVLRVMPVVPASWEVYEDHLQIIRPTGRLTELPADGAQRGLDLVYPERTFSVRLVPLVDGGQCVRTDLTLSKADPALRWGLRVGGAPLHRLKRLVTLWGLSLNGPLTAAPLIEPLKGAGDGVVRVTWVWPTRTWKLRLDPAAQTALVEE